MKPRILQARIKLQFWGELFKLNNNFQNNAKFNVRPALPYATPNMSQRIPEILHHIWMLCPGLNGVTKPFCLLIPADQSTRHFSRMPDETLISTRSIPMCLRYNFNWAPRNEKHLTCIVSVRQKHI